VTDITSPGDILSSGSGLAESSVTVDMATKCDVDNPKVIECVSSHILPVDAHRDTVLKTVERNTVTIIHGETGCGKSSKIPLFLLEDFHSRNKVFVVPSLT
jgi:HrpA-like RNA helicase